MSQQTRQQVARAVEAVQEKKGEQLVILEMDRNAGAFTDYFVLCTGTNPRQIQAISDEVEKQLAQEGTRPNSLEGYNQAEWVLLDYVDFVVHIFSERARKFYDLERLWKSARRLTPEDLRRKPAAAKKAVIARGKSASSSSRSSGKRTAAGPRARKKASARKKSTRRS